MSYSHHSRLLRSFGGFTKGREECYRMPSMATKIISITHALDAFDLPPFFLGSLYSMQDETTILGPTSNY